MSTVRLQLSHRATPSPIPALGRSLHSIRLHALVRFVGAAGRLSPSFRAIVDTGALLSVLPAVLEPELDYAVLRDPWSIGGLHPDPACAIPGKVVAAHLLLRDASGAETPILTATCFLASHSGVPLLLGWDGVLSELDLTVRFKTGEAFVSVPAAPDRTRCAG